MDIERFDFRVLGTTPPQGFKVERANDQFLVLKRSREGFVEQFVVCKTAPNTFALFRIAVSLGEMLELKDEQIIMRGPLANVLAAIGYKCRPRNSVDKTKH